MQARSPSSRRPRPHTRLIAHDLRLARTSGSDEVVATLACERRGCRLTLEECTRCERFERIEVHEAGYTLLCRSSDETPDDEDPQSGT